MSTVIRGKIPELSIALHDQYEGIPFDVTFKIIENDDGSGNEMHGLEREIKGHKFLLACFSPVFRKMFYGPMKEKSEVISVRQTSFTAFGMMMSYIYQVDIDCKVLTVGELFELMNLTERYDVAGLMEEVKIQMDMIPINSLSTMIQLASTARQFSHFEFASATLLSKCAEFFQKNIRADNLSQFMVDQHAAGDGLVALDLLTLVQSMPVNCDNCGEKFCRVGQGVDVDKFRRIGLKVKVNPSNTYWGARERDGNQFIVMQCFSDTVQVKNRRTGKMIEYLKVANGTPTLVFNC